MANKTINVEALCPFFISESKKSITCEGIITERAVSWFNTQEEKIAHEEKYCTKYYHANCEICKAVTKKYAQQKENKRGGITEKHSYKMP